MADLSLPSRGVDPRLVEQHLARLDSRYFDRFSREEIARHVEGIARLGPQQPAVAQVASSDTGPVSCTVLAFDHPGAFSLIAGTLSSLGFDIQSGDIFTWAAAPSGSSLPGDLRRRRLIDHFTGVVPSADRSETWEATLQARLREVFSGLERGSEAALAARRRVNEMAAEKLARIRLSHGAVLYPVRIELLPSVHTRMRVISQDTPFFLFTFSTALSLQGVSIEHVSIRTEGDRIEDEFEIVDGSGRAIQDPRRLEGIKLSVLLTKQFTSFLERAPDPLTALLRFEQLVQEVLAVPEQGRWLDLLSSQGVLRDLAQLLGASTFLWEDFVRSQYEQLLPMLAPQIGSKGFCEPPETLPQRLERALDGARDEEDFARRLNEFKDREIYLFDLDHILTPGSDFRTLSLRLTALAEVVVNAAAAFAFKLLSERHGPPRTVGGMEVRYCILGLGKLGGAALGYASDIELLFLYSDSGRSAGPEALDNSELFDSMVREVPRLIRAKREGIFHVDLRLRPYGAAGPLACSLESFCTYYEANGPAHSYERLSLVRLRAIGGDRTLGKQVERLRDEMIYRANAVSLDELRQLRARQIQEKSQPGKLNAKFSPGALVDLEYAVQILQVRHGQRERRLRTPRIHEALDALASIGVVEPPEAAELAEAYRFFRNLINGLRMLRGSAQDLFLPPVVSDEYLHLARRMGYAPELEITPAQKLHLDFETHSAEVRAFVDRHFGRGALAGQPRLTVADLVLSDSVSDELAGQTLSERGFADPARALLNLRRLAGSGAAARTPAIAEQRARFARLAVLACDVLAQRPDPDLALNSWERFLAALPDAPDHLRQMLSQPMRLELLLSIFSASRFLSDTLVRTPELLDYIGRPEVLRSARASAAITEELAGISGACPDGESWRDELRRLRRREILRIGARDMVLGTPTQRIMEEISDLAEGVLEAALARVRRETPVARPLRFCIIAFGKLGGRELNYSSDLDLLGLCDADGDPEGQETAAAFMEGIRRDLSVHTTEGYAYRVDLRLRPYGSSGQLVYPLAALTDYYTRTAALWEHQALLKARVVAGRPGHRRDLPGFHASPSARAASAP